MHPAPGPAFHDRLNTPGHFCHHRLVQPVFPQDIYGLVSHDAVRQFLFQAVEDFFTAVNLIRLLFRRFPGYKSFLAISGEPFPIPEKHALRNVCQDFHPVVPVL